MKFVQIGGDSRSGGSLLARLFDDTDSTVSYPFENEIFEDRNDSFFVYEKNSIEEIKEKETIQKIRKFCEGLLVSKSESNDKIKKFRYHDFEKNFKEKVQSELVETHHQVFNAIQESFFASIGQDIKEKTIVSHCSRTFVADLNNFFDRTENGYFIHTSRNPISSYESIQRCGRNNQ